MFSPVCIHMSFFKLELCENDDSHTLQECGFSPECILMCLFKQVLLENDDLPTSQEYDFSPVCIHTCLFKSEFCRNVDAQTLQEYGFSPCVFVYGTLNENSVKMQIHTLHNNKFSLLYAFAHVSLNLNFV